MNLVAANARKKKIPSAETLMVSIADEVAPLIAISKQLNTYLFNGENFVKGIIFILLVIKIQSKWQSQLLVYEARVIMFKQAWHAFCISLIEEETKKKKKRNTDFIHKIKE